MAFILREVEGLSTDEICKILEATFTNLGVILYRTRNRRRECLPKGATLWHTGITEAAVVSGERLGGHEEQAANRAASGTV